ncbi:ATP synthase subunit O, mitochondrial-like [Rhopilema esculentum]|uniref:ATP synthase subunit O, mitochondrial-like n=1 Tax=Rhopilema esculentum TaxID=499914 RepID=UPI0031D41FED
MATQRSCSKLARLIGARQFSVSSAVRGQVVKPPLQIYGVEGRYAHALFSAASKKNALDKVEADIGKVKDLLKSEPLLTAYVNDPVVNKRDKQNVLEKILKERKFDELVINFFSSLAENSRLKKANGIFNAFSKLMSSHRGEVPCVITTAKTVEPGQLKDLTSALGGFIKKTESLKVETKVDPQLIGGMVVDIGEFHIDMSIASKVKKMTNNLRDAL